MDFRQLRYFLAVGEELSFSRAAEKCFISQSAISHQIARLEQELGAQLFERSTRQVKLTPAGGRLVPVAQQALSLEATAYSVVRDPRNRVRISANMSFAAQSLEAIARVRDRHPNVDIEFVIQAFTDRIDAIATGDADIALVRGGVDRPGLQTIDLGVDELMIVTSRQHPLSAFDTVELADLAPYPLLLPPRHNQVLIHSVIEDAFVEVGRKVLLGPPIASNHTATLDVLTNPRAWTALYSSTAAETPRAGLCIMREKDNRLRIPVSGVIRSGAGESRVLTELVAALRQSMVLD
ncbi:LysR family transcriptional regulator [Rhodococcus sp. D2-41]|uniref:LysR family transcriptional regulator n=1 Tax=Speluncibacter jeojiensis TaxID=2710754 RepID=A0A9X4M8E8_9ACTN|nr:LysR family transcriptional regulator [Rhodococcus sp. D2-41]MDG3009214.1 LysR family transcriptional regulator [Rhodococcus sp. D2-41]MDG3016111.1 LysR family transcriptional regulator [Corynebacteriales bacterium D3-21]